MHCVFTSVCINGEENATYLAFPRSASRPTSFASQAIICSATASCNSSCPHPPPCVPGSSSGHTSSSSYQLFPQHLATLNPCTLGKCEQLEHIHYLSHREFCKVINRKVINRKLALHMMHVPPWHVREGIRLGEMICAPSISRAGHFEDARGPRSNQL